jgi:DNA adenine methylase
MEPTRVPVRPMSPVAPWIGGKKRLAERLVARIDAIPHEMYAEAFVGMGGVFLRRSTRPRSEVINDFGRDVSNFFRILQRHYVAFLEMLRFQITTRAEFERLCATDPETLTDLERAARFLFLQRTAYGGKVMHRVLGISPGAHSRFDVTRLGPVLEALHERLAGVLIERLDFSEFLERWDHPSGLFYLDPPYWGSEGDYGVGLFARKDFERLAESLAALKGKFLLSINDTPEVRELFAPWRMEPVRTSYSVSRSEGTRVQELIFSNVDPGLFG